MFFTNDDGIHCIFLHVVFCSLPDDQVAYCGARVDTVKIELVLMAVHSIDNDSVGIRSCFDTGNVAVVGEWNVELTGLSTFNVIAPYADLRVVLTGFRVFVAVFSRIDAVFFLRG